MLQLALDLDFSNYSNVVQLRKNNTQPPTPEVKKTEARESTAKTTPTPTTTPTTAKTTAPEISKPIQWYRKFFWRREVPIAKIREWGGGDCRKKATYIKAFAYYTEHYTQKDSNIENVSTPNERAKILADILSQYGIRTEIMCDRFVEIKDSDGKRLDFVYAADLGVFQGPTPKDAAKINKIYGLDILAIINEVEASLTPQSSRSPLPKPKSKPKSKSKSKPLSRSTLPKPKSPCNDNLADNLATPNEKAKILADTLKAEVCYSQVVEPKSAKEEKADEGDIVEITSYWAGEKRGLKTTVTGRNRNFIFYEVEGKEYSEQDGGYQILERGVCW